MHHIWVFQELVLVLVIVIRTADLPCGRMPDKSVGSVRSRVANREFAADTL
jgi:hypothetical protein